MVFYLTLLCPTALNISTHKLLRITVCEGSTQLRAPKPLVWLLTLLLPACAAVGPDYQSPSVEAPASWGEALPRGEEEFEQVVWWKQFNDPVLVTLVDAARADSPTLASALANIDRARANLTSVNSGFGPSLDASASRTRARQQAMGTQLETSTTRSAGFDASWELDLFGKVRRNAEAAQARVDARVDDWHDAHVSLSAEVADTYVQYRGCTQLRKVYEQEAVSRTQTADATRASVNAGISSPADNALARASLANTLSSLEGQRVQCELLLISLVELTGVTESRLHDLLANEEGALPQPATFNVDSVPAQILRQRPDIAALERELAATSAEIGVAKADLYPSLSLNGSISWSASDSASGARTWSFGPSLSIPLFDTGKRLAVLDSARASYRGAMAEWQKGVRAGIKEVENSLANLHGAGQRTEQATTAAQEYRSYFLSSEASWKAGSISLLTLEEARRSALSAEIQRIELLRDQVQYWIALYKALGGGWVSSDYAAYTQRPSRSDAQAGKENAL